MSLFADEMTQTCSLQAPSSMDSGGVVTYGTAVTGVACRSWLEAKTLYLPDGQAIEYRRVLLLPETATVGLGYKVVITGDAQSYQVKHYQPQQLLDASTDHYRCYLD